MVPHDGVGVPVVSVSPVTRGTRTGGPASAVEARRPPPSTSQLPRRSPCVSRGTTGKGHAHANRRHRRHRQRGDERAARARGRGRRGGRPAGAGRGAAGRRGVRAGRHRPRRPRADLRGRRRRHPPRLADPARARPDGDALGQRRRQPPRVRGRRARRRRRARPRLLGRRLLAGPEGPRRRRVVADGRHRQLLLRDATRPTSSASSTTSRPATRSCASSGCGPA